MHIVAGIALGLAVIGGGYQVFQLFAAWWYLRRARRAAEARGPVAYLPPLTLLKPLKGLGVELYQNLASFCRQDYPSYEIICGVESADDPALQVVQQLRHDFPAARITVAIDHAPGTNRKVANLRHMMRHARHDILVLSDGDIRVRPDYLRALVAPLADPSVGLTTCLYRGLAPANAAAVVESLSINTDFTPMVLSARLIEKLEYAFGASIAVRRAALDRIGGFGAFADHLADDYELGRRVANAGYRNVLVPYVVDTVLDSTTIRDVWRHQVRWARTYRICRAPSWFATIVTHATTWGLIALLATGGSPAGWAAFAWAIGLRLGGLALVLRLLDDHETGRWLWLVPLKDLASTLIWGDAFLGNEVDWSGQRYRVEADGRMVAVGPAPLLIPQPGGAPALPEHGDPLRAAGS